MLSLKLDIATRCDRAILGVNVQYILNDKIQLRTLAMFEMKERHTAEYIKKNLLQILKCYDIKLKQIYTITTDNGSNMIKTISLLNEEEDEDDEIEAEENVVVHEDLMTAVHGNSSSDNDTFIELSNEEISVTSVRCAAHSLQLAIHDVLNEKNLAKKIAKYRYICKKLRNTNILMQIKGNKLKKPKIDCPTRWNSTYDMLERLLELRLFCEDQENTYTFLSLDEGEWKFIELFVKIFKPFKDATLLLQKEQLLLGDLYALWLQLKIKTAADQNTMAQQLHAALEKRETNIIGGNYVLAALYLDPRYKILLTPTQNDIARSHLIKIGRLASDLKLKQTSIVDCKSENSSTTTLTDLEMYLQNKEKELGVINNQGEVQSSLADQIFNFNPIREPKVTNVLKYWAEKSNIYPDLANLAKIILAVPATQVSVERNFSVLKLLLTDKRMNLSESNLENILMCRLNMTF